MNEKKTINSIKHSLKPTTHKLHTVVYITRSAMQKNLKQNVIRHGVHCQLLATVDGSGFCNRRSEREVVERMTLWNLHYIDD
jgi:hypothetical protein